jgi:dihydrofolate reductase
VRKVVIRVFDCSLDGVIAEESTDFFEYCRELPDDPAQVASTRTLYENADVHVMGRNLYQAAAVYFPAAVDHPYGDAMNAARKLVFSRTLETAGWANSTILGGDLGTEIQRLKQDGDGNIIAHGGLRFWQSLIRLDLVDEYRVTIFPYLAGKGRRLFSELEETRQLELLSSTSFANGTIELQYRRHR